VNLEEALAGTPRRDSRRRLSPEVAARRRREKSRRHSEAGNLARKALVIIHRDEFDSFFKQALDKVYAECGPLPGDEASS
jgi:hypothetical protein